MGKRGTLFHLQQNANPFILNLINLIHFDNINLNVIKQVTSNRI